MSDFAQRFGYAPPKTDLVDSELPDSLRAGLWDSVRITFLSNPTGHSAVRAVYSPQFTIFCEKLWFSHFREPIDSMSRNPHEAMQNIRGRFFALKFYELYAFLEFCGKLEPNCFAKMPCKDYWTLCNFVFERERSAFRFSGDVLVRISEKEHLEEISTSLTQDRSSGLREHIKRAAEFYSKVPDPDYRNSIKESISAVEATVAFVVGRKTSGITKPLKGIADQYGIHQALRDGFEKLYAWTSDDSGIRHRLMANSTVTQDEARYMLVPCSAFSNYLIALHAKFGAASFED